MPVPIFPERALDPKPNVTESDLASIVRLASVRRLRAAGYGLPPSSTLRKNPYAVVDLDEPDWAKGTLRASSKASPPADGATADRAIEIATQDARIAAQLKLAEQVDLLALPGGVTVGAFLDRHEALAGDVLTFLSTARATGAPRVDGDRRVTLELELPLRRLWRILRPAIPATEVKTPPPAKP